MAKSFLKFTEICCRK